MARVSLGLEIVALLENDFNEEGFEEFGPDTEFFAHSASMCQVAAEFEFVILSF